MSGETCLRGFGDRPWKVSGNQSSIVQAGILLGECPWVSTEHVSEGTRALYSVCTQEGGDVASAGAHPWTNALPQVSREC